MQDPKNCPKCKTAMHSHEYIFAVPGLMDPRVPQRTAISTQKALPVHPWICPNCQSVELYLDKS
jgi:hypothetical protein